MRDVLWYSLGIFIAALAGWLCARALARAVRRRVVAAVGRIGAEWLGLDLRWLAARPFMNPGWWLVQRDRHRMWRSVSAAARAVDQVGAAGAPVGDLPRLATDLRRVAGELDRVLIASAGRPARSPASQAERFATRNDVAALVAAAGEIGEAALAALREQALPSVNALASSVRIEIEAFRTGLESARRGSVESTV